MIYLFLSLIVLLISTYLFRIVSGSLSLTKINMISWVFYYTLILQSFIGSILIVMNIDNHYMINKIQNESSRLYGWLSVQYTMIFLPIGMLLTMYLFGFKNNRRNFNDYIKSPVKTIFSKKDSYFKIPYYFLSFICVLSVFYVLAKLKTNPLTGMLSGLDALELAGLRQDASRGFEGNMYIKNIFAVGLTPMVSYIAYGYYQIDKTLKNKLIFLVLFLASFLILTYDLSKSPFIKYILGFLFLHVLAKGGINKKILITFFVSVVLLILIMYFLVAKVTDPRILFSYNTGIGGRILLSQAAGTYFSFDLFPEKLDFIGINSISRQFTSLFNIEYAERSARQIMEYINPAAVEQGIAGVINSLFVAEAWANFGLLGVLLSPIYVGFIIQFQYNFILKIPKTPLSLAIAIRLILSNPVTGGLNDYFYNMGLVIIIFIFLSILSFGWSLKEIKRGLK